MDNEKIENKKQKIEKSFNECVICLEGKEDFNIVEFIKCKHFCVCIKCFVKVEFSINHLIQLKAFSDKCPLCRGTICSIFSTCNCNLLAKKICDKKSATRYFKFVKNYLNIIPKGILQEGKIINTIIDTYNFISEKKNSICLISSEQSEILLKITLDRQIQFNNLINLLVIICRNSWAIDVAVGGHGVCYFGNFGELPVNCEHTLGFIEHNHNYLIKRKTKYPEII